jgi:hypothetical protein
MLLPKNITLIRYNGVRGASDGVYLGGYRPDKSKSFVCGFIDKMHAEKVKGNLIHEPVEIKYNANYGVYLLNAKMMPTGGSGGGGKRSQSRKLYKPILKQKLDTMTIGTHEAAFFTLINNTELVLVDDIMEKAGMVAMKNSFVLDCEMHESIVLKQMDERFETGTFDYDKALKDIDVTFRGFEPGDEVDWEIEVDE